MNPENRPVVNTLKDVLLYLLDYGHLILVFDKDQSDEPVTLKSLSNEKWATKVAGWIEKNQLPAYIEEDNEEDPS